VTSAWCRLPGMPTGSRAEVEAAARSLLGRGVPQVLVKLGAKGSLLVRGVHNAGNYWSHSAWDRDWDRD